MEGKSEGRKMEGELVGYLFFLPTSPSLLRRGICAAPPLVDTLCRVSGHRENNNGKVPLFARLHCVDCHPFDAPFSVRKTSEGTL